MVKPRNLGRSANLHRIAASVEAPDSRASQGPPASCEKRSACSYYVLQHLPRKKWVNIVSAFPCSMARPFRHRSHPPACPTTHAYPKSGKAEAHVIQREAILSGTAVPCSRPFGATTAYNGSQLACAMPWFESQQVPFSHTNSDCSPTEEAIQQQLTKESFICASCYNQSTMPGQHSRD